MQLATAVNTITELLTVFSLAPIYLFKISGPLTLMKFRPHSFAAAEASKVFPHPGYPYSSKLWSKSAEV